jgi:peptide-methionine (S)-S-oxide reductase
MVNANGVNNSLGNLESATLGGGCFWCLEAAYQRLKGVENVQSGYAGGQVVNPSYEEICTGRTGHAEVVQISYDPGEITFKELLEVFFTIHDPTTLNRQGADVGTQYRSAILYHNTEQKDIAEAVIAEFEGAGIWSRPIVTEVSPLDVFYPAEAYHQDYYNRNTSQGYCQVVISPKLVKLKEAFGGKLKSEF